MATAPPEPRLGGSRAAGARLAVARTLAWALLLGGWLVLGTLGRQYLPLWGGGQAAVAVWLVTVVLAQGLLQSRGLRLTASRLRVALCNGGVVACAALVVLSGSRAQAGSWLLLASCAWGGLLLCASCCVRALRRSGPGRAPSPVSAAVAGALLAWLVAGELRRLAGGPLRRFRYRGLRPALLGAPLTLNAAPAGDGFTLWTALADGSVSMLAQAGV